jgi:electron transfer flavoprotein alpha subunit
MAIIVLAETQNGQLKKTALEACTYGAKLAELQNTICTAVVLGSCNNPNEVGMYGANKVIHLDDTRLNQVDGQVYTSVIADIFKQLEGKTLIISHSSTGKSIAGRLSIRLKAGLVSGVNQLPSIENGKLQVIKPVFSGKALVKQQFLSETAIISLAGNAIKPEQRDGAATVEKINVNIPDANISVKEVSTVKGTVPLPEAEVVVSGGRGFKGPENWGILEELAETLHATTACSRPVADAGWRPHHEHVGQTGIAIRPNLYFAIGISGAIQHLAGVNSSKVIVVINKDSEAPFFKAADYGVVGDLFEVVPRLTASLQKFKANNH